ncbi:MAG: helix-turn-helix domain-containing protein [Parvibaculum sp.]|nr:helix-turn-helix domain-containing protein [Parvibaculum sp.]|tara:strand:+ start:2440 stop:3033 length:594 start_codon:yes stop_codon:yes gene_type:complete
MGRRKKIEDGDLLSVARGVFSERGLVGSSKLIAERAGVSEAALFQRFGTRDKLFFASMMPPSFAAEEVVARAASEAGTPRDALQIIAKRSLVFFREVIGVALVLMSHPSFDMTDIARKHGGENPGARLIAALSLWLGDESVAGRVHCPDPQASADLIVAALHSVVLFEHLGIYDKAAGDARALAAIDAIWPALEIRS